MPDFVEVKAYNKTKQIHPLSDTTETDGAAGDIQHHKYSFCRIIVQNYRSYHSILSEQTNYEKSFQARTPVKVLESTARKRNESPIEQNYHQPRFSSEDNKDANRLKIKGNKKKERRRKESPEYLIHLPQLETRRFSNNPRPKNYNFPLQVIITITGLIL